MKPYKTIQGVGAAELTLSKSRFLAFAARVNDEDAAIDFIQRTKRTHWEATHNCSAYIIGCDGNKQKADDDGEPSGSAGKPILEILKKLELRDTVVVVTRYFGGIKLGIGGLMRAYGRAALMGINAAPLVERSLFARLSVNIDYSLLGVLENNLYKQAIPIEDKEFSESVTLTLLTPDGTDEILKNSLLDWTNGQCRITELSKQIREIPIR